MNPRLTWMLSNRIFLITLASICCLYGLLQLKAHGYSADKISQASPLYEYSYEQLSQPSEQFPPIPGGDFSVVNQDSSNLVQDPIPGADFSVVNQDVSSLVYEQASQNTTQVAQAVEQKLWPGLGPIGDLYEGLGPFTGDDIISSFIVNFGSYLQLKLHDIYGLLWSNQKSTSMNSCLFSTHPR